jgi:hypothetical protein
MVTMTFANVYLGRTAAVRYHNGSLFDLVLVEGSPQYRTLMRTLDSPGPQLHVQISGEFSHWSLNQHERTARILGQMLLATKNTVATRFGLDIHSALILIPNLARFQDPTASSVMLEALQYAGMNPLPGASNRELRPAPVAAAAAASCIGLCKSFTELDLCEYEERLLPESCILGIEYNNVSLSVFISAFQAAADGLDIIKTRAWDLGSGAQRDTEDYWLLVKERIQHLPREWANQRITDVLVMGESSLDEEFLDVMRDALYEALTTMDMRQFNGTLGDQQACQGAFIDPTFAAARGAAELAKRAMEAPDACIENSYCRWWRKLIG